MQMKLNVSWIQGKWQGSRRVTHEYYLTQAREICCDLLVLPELFLDPYFPIRLDDRNFDLAMEKDDVIIGDWQRLAQELQCVVVFPFYEKAAPGLYYNSVLVFEKDGAVCGHYRKTHIPHDPGFEEKYYFAPGDMGITPIETSVGSLGVLICWDQWFPEAARMMALAGADILIYPTAIGWDANEDRCLYPQQCDAWQTMIRSHAIANKCFSLAVNRVGTEEHLDFWGHSLLCAPSGEVLNAPGQQMEQAGCEIQLALIEAERRVWPFFRDRRADIYGDLSKLWRK